jgi:hypothetical protein
MMSEQYPAQKESVEASQKISPLTIWSILFLLLSIVLTIVKLYAKYSQPHPVLLVATVAGRMLGFILLFAPVAFLIWRFVMGRKRGVGLFSFSILTLLVTLLLPV